jgi:hypothetical protein
MNKTRIAIVGLKNNQSKRVAEACSASARLSFLDCRRPPDSLPRYDHIVLMTKFISHTWPDASLDGDNRRKVHLHRGGVSTLIAHIDATCA